MYRIEEFNSFTGQWQINGTKILSKEDAQIMAHHERDDEPIRIRPERDTPYTLLDYAGNDAQLLRATWIAAGRPDYSGDDGA